MEPQTDVEKIEWLWAKLDRLHAENSSLKVALEVEERRADRAEADARSARDEARYYATELSQMAVQLNDARQAAANAVREYVAATGG